MALPFTALSRRDDAWFFASLTSSFPNITESGSVTLCEPQPCGHGDSVPSCKVFHVPSTDSKQALQVEEDAILSQNGVALQDQVLVFQYRGKFHAIDNGRKGREWDDQMVGKRCPHSAFPLAKGIPFDIEDFGVVLSAGLTCPKHGWSFDLFTGRADRSNYMLPRWEVQLRPATKSESTTSSDGTNEKGGESQEVWEAFLPTGKQEANWDLTMCPSSDLCAKCEI
ncbi:hypothetical protein F5X99DRAFT_410832 [Biscogniauxia marginata]|nr:hypothetical protein F5X99DRAFT_410832 [Biscogniauxia marginata]